MLNEENPGEILNPSQEEIQEVCSSLAYLKASSEPFGDGHIALVSLSVKNFSSRHKLILFSCLTGGLSEDGESFHSPVCDNNFLNIVFDSEEAAQKNAISRANAMPKQFIYGAFSAFDKIVTYNQPQQVFFVRASSKK